MTRDEAIKIILDTYHTENEEKALRFLIPELEKYYKDIEMLKKIELCLNECVHNDVIKDYERENIYTWLYNFLKI